MRDLTPRTLRRGALCALLAAAGPACDSVITVEDAAPRVTWVAARPLDAATTELTVWVSDVEGDAVDLEVVWVDGAGAETPIAEWPGSQGTIGLTTREALFDPAGQPHRILWDTTAISGQGRLRFSPDDRPHDDARGAGEVVETPSFDVATGLAEPSEVVPAP